MYNCIVGNKMTVMNDKYVDVVCKKKLDWGLDPNPTVCDMSCDRSSPSSQGPEGDTDCLERRKLRNEDSSYDSDFDPCEPSSPRREDAHEDVSRTASETLGAEFAEYVTLEDKKNSPAEKSLAVITAAPEYTQHVEFGVKLGYSENLIQLALLKLGLNPEKNKLLDELIRLGAGAPKPDTDAEQSETLDDQLDKGASQLRPIIIDGSNVAMSHGGKTNTFSCKGIRLCVDWFKNRGHKELVVLVPAFRKEASKVGSVITDQNILYDLEKEGILSFTPSRSSGGKRIVPYDDRYILKEAIHTGGVIVSNDMYRDLAKEIPAFRKVVEESLLMFSFVNGRFEPPDDPLGRNGPSLDAFLRKRGSNKDAKTCPYLGKCTYGNKCKYTHPERGTAPIKSVTERLQEHAQKHYQDKEKAKSRDTSPGDKLKAKSLSLSGETGGKKPLTRTQSNAPGGEWPKELSQPSVAPKMSAPSIVTSTVSASNTSFDPMLNSVIADSLFTSCTTQKPPPSPYSSSWSWGSQACDPMFSSMPKAPEHDDNPHPKLQRQLSINPVHDTRLNKKYLTEGEYSNLAQHPGQSVPLPQQRIQHFMGDQEHIRPGAPCYSNFSGGRDQLHAPYHPPLTRHSSSQESKSISSHSQPMYPSYMHTSVTRNLSAPDAVWGDNAKRANPHCRLNSTSDSRLNMHACDTQLYGDPFDEPNPRSYSHLQAPGPVGSRPISPHQLPLLQQSMPARTNQHVTQSTSLNPTVGTKPYEDERFKIFYHLSQLFPEAQVRAALVGNPQETDPTKICASILNAAKGNTRSISPPQMPSSFSNMGAHAPLRGSSSLGFSSSSAVDTQREVARMKAYSALSKLFLEEQVRKVMAAYPDETDSNKFCQLLVALNRTLS